jgi:hypothetical protein
MVVIWVALKKVIGCTCAELWLIHKIGIVVRGGVMHLTQRLHAMHFLQSIDRISVGHDLNETWAHFENI